MKRISAVEARRRFGTMLDEVKHQGTEYVIERDSRPAAVVISLEAFQRYQKLAAKRSTVSRPYGNA